MEIGVKLGYPTAIGRPKFGEATWTRLNHSHLGMHLSSYTTCALLQIERASSLYGSNYAICFIFVYVQ